MGQLVWALSSRLVVAVNCINLIWSPFEMQGMKQGEQAFEINCTQSHKASLSNVSILWRFVFKYPQYFRINVLFYI